MVASQKNPRCPTNFSLSRVPEQSKLAMSDKLQFVVRVLTFSPMGILSSSPGLLYSATLGRTTASSPTPTGLRLGVETP